MAAFSLRRLGGRRLTRTRYLTLERDYLVDLSGQVIRRESIRHPGSVVVIPWDGESVVMLDQYRHPLGRVVRELPAGKLDVAGEPPETTARRECVEEVGLEPARLTRLLGIHTSPGYTDEYTHLYLAEGLAPVAADPQGFEEHHAQIVRLSLDEVRSGLKAGAFDDAKTVVGLYALLSRLS